MATTTSTLVNNIHTLARNSGKTDQLIIDYITTVHKIDGINYNGSSDVSHTAVCSTNAATAIKEITVNGFNLQTGAWVAVKWTSTNTANNPQLKINDLDAKPIYYKGSAVDKHHLAANTITLLMYNGSQFDCIGNFNDGSATTATLLNTARSINGTEFDGSADIVTTKWGTARNITISDNDGSHTGSAVSVDGSNTVTLILPDTIKATILGNASTATNATNDANGHDISTTYAPLASPVLTGTPTAPTASVGTNTTQIATTGYVNAEIDNKLVIAQALTYKGKINSASDLPASHKAGWTYIVGTAGTYAGAVCEIGDLIICNTTGSSANNAHWDVFQKNIDGAVTGPSSSTDAHVVVFDGTTGKMIKDSGFTLGKSVPSDAVFTDTHNTSTLYIGSSTGTNNGATSNGGTYLILKDGTTYTRRKITGSGSVSVASDSSGNITITGTDTNTHYTASVVLGASSATSNATSATANSDTYLNIVENSSKSSGIQVIGNGLTTVSAINGVITISSSLSNSGVTSGSYGPSANASPSHSGTFSVPYFTVNENGIVTAASTKTITLPADSNTDTKVTQTYSTTSSVYPVLCKAATATTTTTTDTSTFNQYVGINHSYGVVIARNFYGYTTALSSTTINVYQGACFTKTISAATTFTFSGVISSRCATFSLILTNGGAYTVTWPSSVKWAGGTAPTLTTSGVDVLTFITPNGGTTWYGVASSIGAA